jgi:hypothetical protein
MSLTSVLNPTTHGLLAEAAEWRMIELLFQCPSPAWKREVRELAQELRDHDLRSAAGHAVKDATEGKFHSIFGPGGPAPAREASYQGTIQLGYLMAELKAFYDAFSYAPRFLEPLDHVSAESGFVGFLRLKQAFAVEFDCADEASVAAEAVDRFLANHLRYMAEPLHAALSNSGEPYLELAAKALLRRVGPRPLQMFDILDQEQAADSSFECGAS